MCISFREVRSMRIAIVVFTLAVAGTAAAQPPPMVRLAEFGFQDCAGPTLLSGIRGLAITPDRRIIVLDRSAPYVRIFDGAGRAQVAFARTGQGPAELQSPVAVARRGDGVIEVVDMARSLVRFDSLGHERGVVALGGFATAGAFAPEGGHLLVGLTAGGNPVLRLVRLDSAGRAAVLRRIEPADFPERPRGSPDGLSIAVGPGGSFVVGDGKGSYRIRRYRPDGTPTGEITRDIAKARKTGDEIREEKERRERDIGAVMQRMGSARPVPAVHLSDIDTDRPHFRDSALRFDEQGRLWVRAERALPARTLFDVFDPGGRYVGEVALTGVAAEFALGAGILAAAMRDELGVERVRVFRVE